MWLVSLSIFLAAAALPAADLDHDGLDDQFESQLLAKFQPRFLIPADDCDVAPAEFHPGESRPRVKARNGTIHGQVFKWGGSNRPAVANIEIHYYHLWGDDCGRFSHPLDAEHLSVLVSADSWTAPASAWRAMYWYAGAHETTFCKASTAVKAAALGPSDRGVSVWVSRGKHASFLRESSCNGGCGGDSCVNSKVLEVPRIVNIGEREHLMNGATWVSSWRWRMRAKMDSDFDDALLARLAGGAFVGPTESVKAAQSLVRSGVRSTSANRWTSAASGRLYVLARGLATATRILP